jgi:CubicO group peptidase (beta-lactamase class C family)
VDVLDWLAKRLIAPPSGVAAAVLRDGDAEFRIIQAADPIDQHTPFETGSIGKTMTNLVLVRMARAGMLSLNATVGSFLPAGQCADITLGQLAAHTSGLPSMPPGLERAPGFDPRNPYARFGARQLAALLPRLSRGPERYSDLGYQLLGHILELSAGQSLDSLVQRHVFDPLGMVDSSLVGARPALQGYAEGQPVRQWSAPLPGAGAWQSSVSDLVAYLRAQLAGGAHASDLGWAMAGSIYCHDGLTGGCSSFVAFDRSARTGLVLLANSAEADVTELGMEAMAALT